MANQVKASAVVIVAVCISILQCWGNPSGSALAQDKEKTTEEVYKNIKVLRGMAASQLLGAMNFMAGSLGVSCNHCHVPNRFSEDAKSAKQTARRHLEMMRSINEASFGGKTVINCATCHRGDVVPASALAVAPDRVPASEAVSGSSEALPTVDHVLDRYLRTIGGRSKVEKLETLRMKGTRETRNGADAASTEQVEIYRKAPNKLLMKIQSSSGGLSQAYNGRAGWRGFNGRVSAISGADLLGAKRDADFYKDFRFKQQYSKLVVVGKEKIAEHEAFVIEATISETHPARVMFGISSERLYFDTQSGLLVRRAMDFPTPLGVLPEATDYMAYRRISGVMFPSIIRLSRPPLVVTQRLVEIGVNAQIDDAMFEMPPTK